MDDLKDLWYFAFHLERHNSPEMQMYATFILVFVFCCIIGLLSLPIIFYYY